MDLLKTLYKKKYWIFHNTYLESPKKKMKLAMLVCLILAVFIGGSYFVANKFFDPLSAEELQNGKEIMQTMLFVFMLMFSVFQFFTSAISIVPDFYESPDMQYLISTPIKAKTLLLYKLINHSFNVLKKESFIAFPLMVATGFLIKPSPVFYVVMPIVYFFVVTSSACFGLIIGMILLNKMSIKRYKTLMTIGQNLFLGLVWVVFVFNWIDFERLIPIMQAPIIAHFGIYLLPAYSASHVISEIAMGISWKLLTQSLIFLGLVTAMVSTAAWVANKYFYSGWMYNATIISPKKKSKNSGKRGYKLSKSKSPLWCLVKNQWTMGLKNYELLYPAFMMYFMYGIAIFLVIRVPILTLELRLVLAMVAGFFFGSLGSTLPLMSSEIIKNPKLEKQQYGFFKTFPIAPSRYFLFRILVLGIPTLVVITIGMTIASFFLKLSIAQTMMILVLQVLLYSGYLVQNIGFIILYYQKYYDGQKFLGNLISTGLSLFYYTVTFGLYILTHIEWIDLSMSVVVFIAMAYLLFQYLVFFPLGVKAWAKTEF